MEFKRLMYVVDEDSIYEVLFYEYNESFDTYYYSNAKKDRCYSFSSNLESNVTEWLTDNLECAKKLRIRNLERKISRLEKQKVEEPYVSQFSHYWLEAEGIDPKEVIHHG